MKVLWFTNTPPVASGIKDVPGGGWMRSLESELSQRKQLELGIAYFGRRNMGQSLQQGDVSAFPIERPPGFFPRFSRFFRFSVQDGKDVTSCLDVVRRFQPQLIHVFGTEKMFGLLASVVEVPLVIHLQGLMGPYFNAWVPPGYTLSDWVSRGRVDPFRAVVAFRNLRYVRHAVDRERTILGSCKAVMGRTEWDKTYASMYAPNATYYHCEEALDSVFFEPTVPLPGKIPVFVSVLSSPLYKGHDLVLKTAKVLCETGYRDFSWQVYGFTDFRLAEKKTGIRANSVNVTAGGFVRPAELRKRLRACSVFVHPSYIDNSPNSVCEAQVMGIPVVATDVGGVSSIVENGKTGFLVPANDPLMMASRLREITDGSLALPNNWQEIPRKRHDPKRVANRVLDVYRAILNESAIRAEGS